MGNYGDSFGPLEAVDLVGLDRPLSVCVARL